jgi:hypothetical protein
VFYGPKEASERKVSAPLVPSMMFKPNEYVGLPEPRDFFYLTRRRAEG